MGATVLTTEKKARGHKYVHLAAQLRRQIERGVFKPGDQLPSFAQMLEQYGVFQSTLERVYALLEQEGLVIREPNRGTFVAPPARRNSTGTIGVLWSQQGPCEYAYEAQLLLGIQSAAHAERLEVVLLHPESPIGLEKIDGLLVCHQRAERVVSKLPVAMPAVSLIFATDRLPSVSADDYSGALAAVAHLVSLGHRNIAFLSGGAQQWTDPASKRRLAAYRDAHKAAGTALVRRRMRPVFEPFDEMPKDYARAGYERMRRWLDEDWASLGCTALLAQNDEVAIGALTALQQAGLKVPGDVSVVGFDGVAADRFGYPSLTTVKVPLREIGTRGVDLLLQLVTGGQASRGGSAGEGPSGQSIVLPAKLRVGGSTAAVKGSDVTNAGAKQSSARPIFKSRGDENG